MTPGGVVLVICFTAIFLVLLYFVFFSSEDSHRGERVSGG